VKPAGIRPQSSGHEGANNASKLFEDRAWCITETGALLPHLEALPQHKGEKANEDMRLDAMLAVMPDQDARYGRVGFGTTVIVTR
jgi:hypothetical protein